MKLTNIGTAALTLLIFSCGHPNQKKSISYSAKDTLVSDSVLKEKEFVEKRNQIAENEKSDSMILDSALDKALKIGYQNIRAINFSRKFNSIYDSAFEMTTELEIGNFFSNNYKHLIIHRRSPNDVYIDIYLQTEDRFVKVLSHKEWGMTYVSDTLRDIDGDKLKDFVLNWYGTNGCCLKAFSNVYLFQSNKGTFTSGFEFINPTFSPNEKIIRGIGYGQPGETEMYKYKWDGEGVDTIEYIYFDKNGKGEKTGKVVRSTEGGQITRLLNSVPNEYKKVNGYDWFTGTGYE